MLKPGDQAPDFELTDGDGNTVRLADLAGKQVVLYFYPKDDTPGCTVEACSFRDLTPEFEKRGAAVYGVSADRARAHQKFTAKYGLNFPLLSDPEHGMIAAYGSWGKKKFMGREYEGIMRNTFLIDAAGRIKRVWEGVKPAGHAEEVLGAL
ncbi:MAG TPA: thioredoxin-dependent thiol peroxidase [Candidatus Dormibacteraeota bacterium]|jgi:peroxiredoxin Q/BCP|nr:thioredoxin-dependent thiol peroxidase [Candidatus Dormibacteraeota bacterium]